MLGTIFSMLNVYRIYVKGNDMPLIEVTVKLKVEVSDERLTELQLAGAEKGMWMKERIRAEVQAYGERVIRG